MLALKDIIQFSDPSFYAFHHSNADVLQPTGATIHYICAGLPLGGVVEEGGGWHAFFTQVQEASSSQSDTLQPINQITSCVSIHLSLTSHLLIFL